MTLTIAIVLSLCGQATMPDALKKKAELEKLYPQAKITVRVDKKCAESNE